MLLAVRYALRHDTIEQAAAAMALDLMRSDPTSLKRGYTEDNALIAVKEQFGFGVGEWMLCEPTIKDLIAEHAQRFPDKFCGVGWPE